MVRRNELGVLSKKTHPERPAPKPDQVQVVVESVVAKTTSRMERQVCGCMLATLLAFSSGIVVWFVVTTDV